MALVGKLVSELEINAAAHQFFKIFKDQMYHVPNISPNMIQKVELHEGDWNTHGHGSIKIWNYTVDGKAEVFKERVEFDEEKLMVSIIGLEGDVFKHYKAFNLTYQVVPKGSKQSLIVMTLEYEKLDDGSPYPYLYLDLMNKMAKDIETHLK